MWHYRISFLTINVPIYNKCGWKVKQACRRKVPRMTRNAVCGWSREIAIPRAFRYFFSWSKFDSSCCLWRGNQIHKHSNYMFVTHFVLEKFKKVYIKQKSSKFSHHLVTITSFKNTRLETNIYIYTNLIKHKDFLSLHWNVEASKI